MLHLKACEKTKALVRDGFSDTCEKHKNFMCWYTHVYVVVTKLNHLFETVLLCTYNVYS